MSPTVTVSTRTVDTPRQDVGTCIVAGCADFGAYVVTADPAPRAWAHPLHCCGAHLEACIGLRLFDSGTEIKRRAQEAARCTHATAPFIFPPRPIFHCPDCGKIGEAQR